MLKETIPDGFINVKTCGASGNGVDNDSAAFKKALEADHAKVYIPKGVYTVSVSLCLSSGIRLVAHQDAIIRLADRAGVNNEICLLRNSDYEHGNSDISIDGGTWDINCQNNPRGEEYDPQAYSGVGMSFIKVNGLQIRNIAVVNPDSFYVRIGETTNFHFENITFKTSLVRPNQDGIHIGGFCRNGIIRNIHGLTPHTPNDDMIAINADDDITRHFNRGMKCGPIENIIIENIKAISTYTFVRLLSCGSTIKNILIRNVSGAAEYYAVNADSWRFPKGTGLLENIVICDMNISKLKDSKNHLPLIIINSRTKNFIIDNFSRSQFDNTLAPSLCLDNNAINTVTFEGLTANQMESLKTKVACEIYEENSCWRGIIDKDLILQEGSIGRFYLTSEDKMIE